MRHAILLLLLVTIAVPVFAAPLIDQINPVEGFSYGPTHVTLLGSGFNEGALQVLFGNTPATILESSATHIHLLVVPEHLGAAAHEVDVTVRVAGHGETVLHNAFYFSPTAQATAEDYTQVLVPLTGPEVRGANGSIWTSVLRVFNASTQTLRMPGPESFIIELPIDPAVIVPPRTTEEAFLNRSTPSTDGAFLYIPNPLLDAPKFSLRVRDLSKNATSFGTEIPVVRQSEGKGDLAIMDLPIDPKYRITLRVYGFTDAPMHVGMTVYPEDGDTILEQRDVALSGIVHIENDPMPPYPAYAVLDPISAAVRASGHTSVRVELTNYNAIVSPPPPKIWAFATITNNETQQVTVAEGQ